MVARGVVWRGVLTFGRTAFGDVVAGLVDGRVLPEVDAGVVVRLL